MAGHIGDIGVGGGERHLAADRGVSGLGLIMQLGGGVWLGIMAMFTISLMVLGTKAEGFGVFIMFGMVSMIRSIVHMVAGSSMLNSPDRSEFNTKSQFFWTYFYIAIACLHALLFWFLLKSKLNANTSQAVSIAMTFLAWPATLLIALQLPILRAIRERVPTPVDRGVEQAGVLMAILGTIGVIFGVLSLVGLTKIPKAMSSVEGMMIAMVVVALVVRSVFHARAGLKAVKGQGIHAVADAVQKYQQWGMITMVVAGGVLFLVSIMNDLGGAGFTLVITFSYLLFLWPRVVGRFVHTRCTTHDVYGDEMPDATRSPNMGLAALGWLLLALAVMGLVSTVPNLLLDAPYSGRGLNMPMFTDFVMFSGRSMWWGAGVSCLQLWAALELLSMSPRYKIAALAYGVAGVAINLYMAWPVLKMFSAASAEAKRGGFVIFNIYGQMAMAVVVPVAVFMLVQRGAGSGGLPRAQARFRDADEN